MARSAYSIIAALVFLVVACPGGLWAADWLAYASDTEGKHFYDRSSIAQAAGVVKVMTSVVYTSEGRSIYLARRQKAGMSNAGLDQLHYRAVRYEINCFSDRKEFTTLEIMELSRDGKVLDYAKAGGYKEWADIPEGSALAILHKTVCPARR